MPLRHLHHSHLTSPTARTPHSTSATEGDEAWFSSLDELDLWWIKHRDGTMKYNSEDADAQSWLQRSWAGPTKGAKLRACHDFKGGYADQPFERGYTFEWWAMTDIFIYFSHHRITIPPDSWITAAHTQGTRILGVLILEWEQSLPDTARLVQGPDSPAPGSKLFVNPGTIRGSRFPTLSTHYADALIDLAVARGFDGWLVNVECDLLKACQLNPLRGGEWARAIRVWCEYLRREGERRLGPGWEISWYDSIMHTTGQLRWQSRLHPINTLPFACSATSTFLDYHWAPLLYPFFSRLTFNLADRIFRKHKPNQGSAKPSQVPETLGDLGVSWRNKLLPRESHDIYLGVDLFGRGCPFGGGFAGTRAAIEADAPGLSVALFGNGWTWECHHLHPGRKGQEGEQGWWEGWWEDERYMWTGLSRLPEPGKEHRRENYQPYYAQPPDLRVEPTTGNALRDAHRIDREAERAEGPQGRSHSELPRHLAWLTLFRARPQPCTPSGLASSSSEAAAWSTSFSVGSGCAFWVRGENVLRDQLWTDISMSQPKPDLAVGGAAGWCVRKDGLEWSGWQGVCETVDGDGWMGSGCIEVRLGTDDEASDGAEPTAVPLISTSHVLRRAGRLEVDVVWKTMDDAPAGIFVGLGAANVYDRAERPGSYAVLRREQESSPPVILAGLEAVHLKVEKVEVEVLPNGWRRTTCNLAFVDAQLPHEDVLPQPPECVTVSRLGVVLPRPSTRPRIGCVSVIPRGLPDASARPSGSPEGNVEWQVVDSPAGAPEGTLWGNVTFRTKVPFGLCLIYATRGEDLCFLGTSRTHPEERRFLIAGLGNEWTGVRVREVNGDGVNMVDLGYAELAS